MANTNFMSLVNDLQGKLKEDIYDKLIEIWPLLIGAIIVFVLGIFMSILAYKLVIYLFKRFKILELLDKLDFDFDDDEDDKKEAEEHKMIKTIKGLPSLKSFEKRFKLTRWLQKPLVTISF